MTRKNIHALILMLLLPLHLSLFSNRCQCQTIKIKTDEHVGHGFKTTEGTITAMHVGGISYDYSLKDMDIVIDSRSRSPSAYKVSDNPPAYFIDRRGIRHRLRKTGSMGSKTTVSIEFYPGESGMPVFSADGSVACVVIGNVHIGGRWFGLISRVTPIVDFANKSRKRNRIIEIKM